MLPTCRASFLVTIIVWALGSTTGWSQSSNSSPYSIFGLGDLESSGFAQHHGRGNARLALSDPFSINLANPATHSSLGRAWRGGNRKDSIGYPILQLGIGANLLRLENNDATQDNSDFFLRNISVGLPLKKNKWGLAFGLVPFTLVGYEINTSEELTDGGNVSYIYEGTGGINRAYVGTGYRLISKKNQTLDAGINGSYLFGTVEETRRTLLSGGFNTRVTEKTTVSDINFDLGLNYRIKLWQDSADYRRQIWFSVAATYTNGADLNATNNLVALNYTGNAQNEIPRDTAIDRDLKGDVTLPPTFGFGIAAHLFNQWTISADFTNQDWSQYRAFGIDPGLGNRTQYAVGIQYVNNPFSIRFVEQLHFRAGFRYADSRLIINDQQLTEYGISFGLGIPISRNLPMSYLNLSTELGQRGDSNPGLIREQFARINFGLSLSPIGLDGWFQRRKIQ